MTNLVVKPNQHLRWHPFDQMFEDMFDVRHRNHGKQCCHMPPVDIAESKDDIKLTFEIPGMKKDDIKVTIKERVMTVSGNREENKDDENVHYITSELRSGSFSRSFTLPKTVDADKIKADYQQGMLTIALEKVPEVKPKEVEISVS